MSSFPMISSPMGARLWHAPRFEVAKARATPFMRRGIQAAKPEFFTCMAEARLPLPVFSAAFFGPSASRSPMPSRSPIFAMRPRMASLSPKASFSTGSFRIPFSPISRAHAMVTPTVSVSMP